MKNHPSYLYDENMIFGMLSKNYKLLTNDSSKPIGFIKNRKQVVILDHNDIEYNLRFLSDYEKVACSYLSEENVNFYKEYCKFNNLVYKKSYKMNSVISGPFNENVISLFDNKNRNTEIRETINKFDKILTIKKYEDVLDKDKLRNDFIELIGEWDKLFGKLKYGWQNHSGYDRNFFINYFPDMIDRFYSYFYYAPHEKLIGYSFVSKKFTLLNNDNVLYFYLLRKFVTSFEKSRNIGLYIDYTTFKNVIRESGHPKITIHWGGSGGGVLRYKLSKFPLFSEEKYYSGVITKCQ